MIINKLNTWLDENHEFDNIRYRLLIKILIISLPLTGVLYRNSFLSKFNINYSLYFDIADPIFVLYDKGIILVYIILFTSLIIMPFLPFLLNQKFEKNQGLLNLIILANIVLALFLVYYLKIYDSFDELKLFGLIMAFSIIINVFILFVNIKWIHIYIYILFLAPFAFPILLANKDYKTVLKTKSSFDIQLPNGEFILKENDKSKFFIGNTSSYIFIYNICNEKVNAYPKDGIKISFFKKN